jgi:hypothetical protein
LPAECNEFVDYWDELESIKVKEANCETAGETIESDERVILEVCWPIEMVISGRVKEI